MERKLTMILAFLFLSLGGVMAQTQVSGTVVSQDNEPIIGVSILVVGTNVGTVTGSDGHFSLTVPAGKSMLRISYVGMETLEVSARPNMRIVLRDGDTNLDEIVVTAMGIKRQAKALGYSATAVDGEKISQARTSDIMSSLQGKVAGVQIRLRGRRGRGGSRVGRSFLYLTLDDFVHLRLAQVGVDAASMLGFEGANLAADPEQ